MHYRFFILFLFGAAALAAQTATGAILGTVTDPSGAAIGNVQITVTSEATNTSRKLTSNEMGAYVVPFLPAGLYSVAAEAPGFRRVERTSLLLQAASRLTVDLRLELGATTEQITVQGQAPLVDSASTVLGQVIENRRIVDLPLNGREPFALANLTPGVMPAPTGTANSHLGGAIPAVGGASNFTSEVTIDGMPNTTPRNSGQNNFLIFTPTVDAVEEFKVQTNMMSAEYGRFNGGLISVVTKSGTNGFHGSLYEFHRNSVFDANNFFANRAGIPLGSFRRNQFGAAIGGPVLIPRLYSGRDKTFWFFNYEGFRESALDSRNFTMPTARELGGDFSQTRNAANQLILIYDPFAKTPNANGIGYTRGLFPGNLVPGNRIHPVARNLSRFFPAPTNDRPTNNFDVSTARINVLDSINTRVDHYVGSSHRLMGRFSWQEPTVGEPNFYGNIANSTPPPLRQRRRSATMQDVWTISPTVIVDFNYGLSRMFGTRTAWSDGLDITTLGFAPSFRDGQQVRAIPVTSISGYAGLGQGSQNYSTQTSHTLTSSATLIRGGHTIKTGLDYRVYYNNQLQNTTASSNLSYSLDLTQGPDPNRASATAGNGLATFLLGHPGGSISSQPAIATKSTYTALFFQDDWRVSRRLTLNLGLRYDMNIPRTERWDRMSTFDLAVPSPLAGRVAGFPDLRGAMTFRGPGNRAFVPTDWNNLAPRLGIAYLVTSSTTVRAGYGIFNGLSPTDAAGHVVGYTDGFSASTNVIRTLDGTTPISDSANPFPAGINRPQAREALNAATFLGLSHNSALVSMRTPYYQQWNFTIQQGLGKTALFEAAYAGNKGTRLALDSWNLNALTAEQNLAGVANQQLVPNPFLGVITDATSSLSLPTVQRGALLRPFPQYTGVTSTHPTIGNSVYHALMARVERRFAQGFTILGAYTFSKNINNNNQAGVGPDTGIQDPYNLRAERSVDSQDVPHRLVISGVYELPFGRGKAFGGAWPRAFDLIAGGWQLNGIATYQAGFPLIISSLQAARPNRTGKGQMPGGRVQDRLDNYFDTSVFTVPAPFTFGNSARTLANMRRHGDHNYDLSLFKSFGLFERIRAQLRFEAFNALNRVRFAAPNTQIGGRTVGQINGQDNAPRQLQIALKILF